MFLGEFCLERAFMHALITLCGLAVPSDFATISFMPRTSHTALTAPPAIMPVPLGADLNLILPAPSLPNISWWIVLPSLRGIWIRFLLANSFAFLIASGTCFALAWATPILPFWFPTTTSAEKPSFAHLKNLTQSYSGSLPDWRILESGKKRHSWTNLQLPLYVHTAKSIFEQRDIASGYFNLTNSKQSTKIDMWTDLNDEHIESAVTCAENIANEIKNGNFWPPSDKVKYDNYSDIFFDDCESSFDPSEITNKWRL